jgi:DNA-binding winged helix-turn-helix (wHTH) protein/tetratricopeptide (TPR) repeat protein
VTDTAPQIYRFGGYTLEARERRLLGRDGAAVALKPRAFDTLLCLVERAGHLVTKEELFARLWPDSVVEESNLAKNVWQVRRALADPDGEARFVETVARAGYRFVAPVERLAPPPPQVPAAPEGASLGPPTAPVASRPPVPGDVSPVGAAPGQGAARPLTSATGGSRGWRNRRAAAARGAALTAAAVAGLLAVWLVSARLRSQPERATEGAGPATPRTSASASPGAVPALPGIAAAQPGEAAPQSGATTLPSTTAAPPGAAPARAIAAAPGMAATVRARPAVAVLGFENLSGRQESAWLAMALAEMVGADLAAGEALRLVPGADAMRFAGTLPPGPGALSRDGLDAARRQLDADYVVKGSYVALPGPQGEALRLDVLVQSTASGETAATASETGASHRLFALVDGAAARLRAALGVGPQTATASEAAAAAALPAQPEAARFYAEGLELLRRYDALGARRLLERAIAIEPRFPLAHVALGQTMAALGYDAAAVAEAKQALALAGRLPRARQLEIAALLAEARTDWTAAIDTNRSLFAFFPDNLEYGLSLARTQVAGGKAADALTVVAALRRRPAPAGDDPRLDLAEAAAAGALSDWRRQLACARRAEATARAHRLSWLLGDALLDEAAAASSLGQPALAAAAHLEALEVLRRLGNPNAVAGALIGIAVDQSAHGDYDGALAGYAQALAAFERTGNRKGAAHVLCDIANLSWLQGDVQGCLRSAGRELALSRDIADRRGIVWGLGAIGNALADQGEIERALQMQTEALAITRDIGDREYAAFCTGAIADTHLAAGDLDQAYRGYGDALDMSRRLEDAAAVARHQDDLATVLLLEGRLDESDRLFGAALAARRRMQDQDEAAQTTMNLAQLRTEQGRAAEGLALARQAEQAFAAMHQSGNTAMALAAAALAEIALHQPAAALADCERAHLALRANRQNQPNLAVQLAQAHAEAAAGHLAAARSQATAALARGTRARSPAAVLEARLILGELELREHPDAAAHDLAALAQEARTKRFLLIARKADGLAASGGVVARLSSQQRP